MDAENPEAFRRFFWQMAVEVRPFKPLSEVAKML
jgi:hypothetical protein